MQCNYDSWNTKVPKSVTPKMRAVLKVMKDGKVRHRPHMLRKAGIDPNPRSASGYMGFETADYFLYKKGLLEYVGEHFGSKQFKISALGSSFVISEKI